ncbi:hypothetical protein B5F13_14065 [Drancourtella sp. An177]|nr:hypothetical protein B5F13_14065 [Drancourtella sp. An177]
MKEWRGTTFFITCLCLERSERNDKKYEIGFHLRPKFWGQGYAVEAAKAVIDYAFKILQAEAVYDTLNLPKKSVRIP